MAAVRGPAGVRLLVEFARERGVASETTLAGTGLLLADLTRLDTAVEIGQELRAIANVLAVLGDRAGLGSALGARFSVAAHGDVGFAIMTCATVREAAELTVRYAEPGLVLHRVRAREERGGFAVELDSSALPPAVVPFIVERDIVAFTGLVSLLVPGGRLQIQAAVEADRVAAIAAVRPEHQVVRGPRTVAFLDAALLARPMPTADEPMAREFGRRLDERLRRAATGVAFASRVRGELWAALPHRASAGEVAQALHVSARTLRRRLEDEGTTFQRVSDEALCEYAQDLLRAGLSTAEVASRMGYADVVGFTRAFKRWTNQPPAAWARSRTRD
jgi:AraC-like DNA-binding protein